MDTVKLSLALTVSLLLIAGLSAAFPKTALAETSAVDPVATEILKRMTDHLGNTKQFSVRTENTLEYLHSTGHRVDIDVTSDVIISRPNKLRAERHGELVDQVFFYNGKMLTLYNPLNNVYATEPVPDSYLELFRHMAETFGFAVPVSDLVLKDAFHLLMEDVNLAVKLGQKKINGVMCDHLLFSRPGVDFQLWITSDEKPLPYKYVVTDTTMADRLSIRTRMSGWNFDPAVKATEFTFRPTKEVQKISFIPL